jgi:CRISPR-associated protein Cas6
MVDVAFPLDGHEVPREHRCALAEAVGAIVPWLPSTPGAGVHPIKVVAGHGPTALLSLRARLVLRVPRSRVAELGELARRELSLRGRRVRLGAPTLRELLPHRTLYAELVVVDCHDEAGFLEAVAAELRTLGVTCTPICGRARAVDDIEPRPRGQSLMLDALSVDDARRVLDHGLGTHRSLGCGLFVPHRSAAAVT